MIKEILMGIIKLMKKEKKKKKWERKRPFFSSRIFSPPLLVDTSGDDKDLIDDIEELEVEAIVKREMSAEMKERLKNFCKEAKDIRIKLKGVITSVFIDDSLKKVDEVISEAEKLEKV